MSKFLLNLLVQISKSLVYSKIKFYSEIIFPPILAQPAQPRAALAASPVGRHARARPIRPLGLSSLGVFAKRCLFFKFAQSVNDVSSHVATKWAPPVRSTPFLAPANLKHVSTAPHRN
jgi:hypothetical protein